MQAQEKPSSTIALASHSPTPIAGLKTEPETPEQTAHPNTVRPRTRPTRLLSACDLVVAQWSTALTIVPVNKISAALARAQGSLGDATTALTSAQRGLQLSPRSEALLRSQFLALRALGGDAPPWLQQAEEIGRWHGLRARPHGRPAPLLEVLEPGLILATGHYRNGVLLAPATAEWVCDQLDPSTSNK